MPKRPVVATAARPRPRATPARARHQSPQPPSIGRQIVRRLAELLLGAAALGSAAAGGGYAVEKWHETKAAINLGGEIDQKKPFIIPLLVSNPSTLFTMWGVKILCHVEAQYSDGPTYKATASGNEWAMSGAASIPPRESSNFSCDFPDKFTLTEGATPGGKPIPLASATMTLALQYDTHAFVWTIPQPFTETFTLLNTSTGYRWVKGSWLNSP
jgi:hypothetical protein